MAVASLMPLALDTTLTAPDCVAPPTVIEDLVMASVKRERRKSRFCQREDT